jgi:hypothetical protein
MEESRGARPVPIRSHAPLSVSDADADEVEVETFQPHSLWVVPKRLLSTEFGALFRACPHLGGKVFGHATRSFALGDVAGSYSASWVHITLLNAGRRGGQKPDPFFALRFIPRIMNDVLKPPSLPPADAFEIRFPWPTAPSDIPGMLPFSEEARAYCAGAASDLAVSALVPWLHRQRRRVESELCCLPTGAASVWLRDVAPLRQLVLAFLFAPPLLAAPSPAPCAFRPVECADS